jgi:predicted molibdopterin-dependent oxidoreductase YjgC
LPESFHPALDRFRAPLSAIRDANVCLVVGDHPVVERAPIVDLWLRQARREGAEVITIHPAGSVPIAPGSAASVCAALLAADPPKDLRSAARSLKRAERVALVWSQDDPTGGAHIAALADGLGGNASVYFLPRTPNGRGVAAAWGEAAKPPEGEIGALIVSGNQVGSDLRVRELAERARFVLATAMFESELTLWSHVVVPGTSYLERDGTFVNLEGRPQTLRRTVSPPGEDDELVFFAHLAGRFGVEIDPWPGRLPDEHAPLPPAEAERTAVPAPAVRAPKRAGRGLELVRYRGLFSGPAVERVPQLQFQRALAEVEISAADARERGIAGGDPVLVGSNGTSKMLTARLNRRLLAGVVRIEDEHAEGLASRVEVTRA